MKKIKIIVFSALACISLTACTNNNSSDTKSAEARSESIAKKSSKDKQSSIAESKKAVSESIESSKAKSSSLAEESSSKAASSSMAAKLAETKSKLAEAVEISKSTESKSLDNSQQSQQNASTPATSSNTTTQSSFEQDLQNLDIHQFINKYGETPVGYLIKNRGMSTKAALNMVPMEMKVSGEIQEGYLIQQGILDDYGHEVKK